MGPVCAAGLVEGGAEEPVSCGVDECEGDGVAADVEVGGVGAGCVDRHATAGRGAFGVFVEGADGGGGLEGEVGGCEGGEEEEVEADHFGVWFCESYLGIVNLV